jgi:hypothetical protein
MKKVTTVFLDIIFRFMNPIRIFRIEAVAGPRGHYQSLLERKTQ